MMPTKTKKTVSIILSLLIFLLIIGVGVKYRTELFKTLQSVNLIWVFSGLFCYLVNYLARAKRIQTYSDNTLQLFPDTLRITTLHGFASYFLPMRSGDLSLPALLKFYHDLPLAQGSRILLRARFMDVLSLGILLSAAAIFSAPQLKLEWRLLFLGTGVSFIGFPYLFILLTRWKKEWFVKLSRKIRPDNGKQLSYPKGKELLYSLVIWFWTGCTTFCVIRSLDIPLTFLDVWFFAAIQLPLQLLPIQGLANSGNHEAGWLTALKLLEIAPPNAMAVTLASHLILIGYVLLLGAFGALLSTGISCRRSTKMTESKKNLIS